MKKTLLVTAVALAVSGSAIADTTWYGNIRLGLQTANGSPGGDELDVKSGKLVLGAKGSSDLGNGMTASFGVELEHDQADVTANGGSAGDPGGSAGVGTVDFDKSWVALAGDFGKVTAGRRGSLSGYACGGTDILTMGSAEACDLGLNTEVNNAIMYTGSAGAFDFGYIFTADGTIADDDSAFGFKFNGDNWSVGFQGWNNEAGNGGLGTTPTQIGATYQLGDIGLGITLGDDDTATDSGGTDLGLSMPLGGGTVRVVVSTLDAPNSDSADVNWTASLGGGAYYGVEINTKDAYVDDRVNVWVGMNF